MKPARLIALVALLLGLAAGSVSAQNAPPMTGSGRTASFMAAGDGPPVRIKDLATFEGVRGNDLVGYGLVVGLAGTGDSLRNSPFTEEALQNLLERLGVNVTGENFRPKNVAAVLVTANLPAFARAGGRIDVAVSAIGDASSLHGGTLVMTPLNAADGQIYAVAQGPIVAGGISAQTQNASTSIGVPTVGDIPGGASVEREVAFDFESLDGLTLALRQPDFTTALSVADTIEAAEPGLAARALDSRTVRVVPRVAGMPLTELVGRVERLQVRPDSRAVIVMDQSAGTIVVGGDIPLPPMSITHGGIKIEAKRDFIASQPNPFAEGETVVLPVDTVGIQQGPTSTMRPDPGATVQDVVEGLSAIGLSALEIMDILQTIKASGMIHSDFVIR